MAHGPVSDMRVLLDGFGMGESPRWHQRRLWFSSWGSNEIIAVDLEGNSEVIGAGGGRGWAVDWLPDGRMLVTGTELMRVEPDGSRVGHADLSQISRYGWSELTVDGRGNAYVNSLNFDFANFMEVLGSGQAPGKIALVTADGTAAREVADGLAFPNGMTVTPDNSTLIVAESFAARLTAFDIDADGSLSNRRVWADVTGDGICIDAEGAVWCSAVGADGGNVVQRVREGGEIIDRIEVDRPCYACMLGGEDGRTLFMVVQQWFGPDRMDELIEAKTGQILTARVAVPHAGWP
jgi:sugar lactone lactonase YvrE